MDAGSAGGEIVYAGGTLLDLNRYELYYQFDFTAKYEITEEDTRQAEDVNALPDLSLLSIDVDYIDLVLARMVTLSTIWKCVSLRNKSPACL